MGKKPIASWIYLMAAILLLGLGFYYFIFEREEAGWWIFLLAGGIFNLFLAYKSRNPPAA